MFLQFLPSWKLLLLLNIKVKIWFDLILSRTQGKWIGYQHQSWLCPSPTHCLSCCFPQFIPSLPQTHVVSVHKALTDSLRVSRTPVTSCLGYEEPNSLVSNTGQSPSPQVFRVYLFTKPNPAGFLQTEMCTLSKTFTGVRLQFSS